MFQTIDRSGVATCCVVVSHVTSMLLMYHRIIQLKMHLLRSCRKPLQKLVVTRAWLHSRGDPNQVTRYCHTAITNVGFVHVSRAIWQALHSS